MGLFNRDETSIKTKPIPKIEKVKCEGCGKWLNEEDLNMDNLCDGCEGKYQCTDCEKWFIETDDDDRCKACAAKAKAEADEEEQDCACCEKTFKQKELITHNDEQICEKCLKEKAENTSTSLYVRTGFVTPVWKISGPRKYINNVYNELVVAKKDNKEFIEITLGPKDNEFSDKTFIKLANVIRIDISYTTDEWDGNNEYPVTNYDTGNEVE